jgi:hypothetical protein
MAIHSNQSTEIKNPGPWNVSSSMRNGLIVMAVLGFVIFGVGLTVDAKRAWASFLHNHFYFMSLALGGLFFAAIQWLTSAMWSAPIRRVSESFTSYLPIAMVTFVVVAVGIHEIYHWSHAEVVQGDIVLEGKAGYLSMPFFIARNLIAMGIWVFFAWKMVGNSIKQDSVGGVALTFKNKSLAPAFLILFALSFTMASFDQLMSLDPHWFSTMFGVYCFAGLFYSTLALTAVVTVVLKRRGLLEGIVSEEHFHDLGKFMFAFTTFWAYIGFSQFMLIWYANLPEETGYFLHRFDGSWLWVSIFLLVGKFLTPFLILLPRENKRNPTILFNVGIFMLVAQWIDILWMIQPEFFKDGPRFFWIEAGTTIGFIGLFGFMITRFLSRNNVVAFRDPRLAEAVFHHHQ